MKQTYMLCQELTFIFITGRLMLLNTINYSYVPRYFTAWIKWINTSPNLMTNPYTDKHNLSVDCASNARTAAA